MLQTEAQRMHGFLQHQNQIPEASDESLQHDDSDEDLTEPS